MRVFPSRKYVSGTRWCIWRWTDVDPDGDGETYLTRLHLLQIPWFSCMLHWILRADPQPDLHDHPNAFIAIVLRGWYEEEIPKPGSELERTSRRISLWNFKNPTDKHRILALDNPTLTLVFAGPVVRGWGFQTKKGWEPWRKYVARRQASSDQAMLDNTDQGIDSH